MRQTLFIITLLLCFQFPKLQAQNSYASLVRNYIDLLNDWFEYPSDYAKRDAIADICKKCYVKDEIVIQYSMINDPVWLPFKSYLSFFYEQMDSTKRTLHAEIVCVKTNTDTNQLKVNAIIKYTGAIELTTTCNFWINNGQITIIESNNFTKFTINGITFLMRAVEGGRFKMGKSNNDGSDEADEKPHSVDIKSFYIGETEVTQGLWKAVMNGANPSKYVYGDDYPVERVSWDSVQIFLKKIDSLTNQKFRLPTEAEWEDAAYGGGASQGYKYSGSNDIDSVAQYGYGYYKRQNNQMATTFPVKEKQPNELGIYDMSGNVWEWCQDWYDKDYKGNTANVPDTIKCIERVMRGGSWRSNRGHCRIVNRMRESPNRVSDEIGFRLVLDSY